MAFETTGKIVKILSEQRGAGRNGEWVKQDFVIETGDQYPKKMCFTAWGEKVDELKNMSEGSSIKVFFNIESREYNERWYTDLRIWKFENAGGNAPTNNSQNYSDSQSGSFGSDTSSDSASNQSSMDEDDLPF